MTQGRPPRDRESEWAKAHDVLDRFLQEPHKVRKLEGREADLLHRTFSSVPEAYDAWEYETR